MKISMIGVLLRMSGAFFIKRSFSADEGDELYKSILKEYVTRLLMDDSYLEFFIEGKRSRTGKVRTLFLILNYLSFLDIAS